MKAKRTSAILSLMLAAVTLVLLTACSDGGSSVATINVRGAAVATRSTSGEAFTAAEISVNGDSVTGLEKTNDPTESTPGVDNSNTGNDTEFEVTVPDVPTTITISVEPHESFVFDEWEIRKHAVKRDYPDSYREKMRELYLTDAEAKSENLIVLAEDAQYYIASFDRGYYVDLAFGDDTNGKGTKSAPFKTISTAITAYKNDSRFGDDDDDEITLKLASGDSSVALDFSHLALSTRDDEIEIEMKVHGGYDRDWNVDGRTSISSISLPTTMPGSGDEVELEIELELHNLAFDTFDVGLVDSEYESPNVEIETEIDMRNCLVKTLTGNGVANGVIMADGGSVTGNVTFVNSVVPYEQGSKYYHSIVTIADTDTVQIADIGLNNIVLKSDGNGTVQNHNLVMASTTEFEDNGCALKNPTNVVYSARPLEDDDDFGDNKYELDDDYLEEDITGAERRDDDDERWDYGVSYGPYEYFPERDD